MQTLFLYGVQWVDMWFSVNGFIFVFIQIQMFAKFKNEQGHVEIHSTHLMN
jgi:hypothetical protein